jgi:hypothetical protein
MNFQALWKNPVLPVRPSSYQKDASRASFIPNRALPEAKPCQSLSHYGICHWGAIERLVRPAQD